jgi:hypothetical protein
MLINNCALSGVCTHDPVVRWLKLIYGLDSASKGINSLRWWGWELRVKQKSDSENTVQYMLIYVEQCSGTADNCKIMCDNLGWKRPLVVSNLYLGIRTYERLCTSKSAWSVMWRILGPSTECEGVVGTALLRASVRWQHIQAKDFQSYPNPLQSNIRTTPQIRPQLRPPVRISVYSFAFINFRWSRSALSNAAPAIYFSGALRKHIIWADY